MFASSNHVLHKKTSTFVQFCNTTQRTIGEPNNYSHCLLSFYFCDHTESNNSDQSSFHKICNP